MANKMKFADAEKLKAEIREAASEADIDLDRRENEYTLWFRNGPQGLMLKEASTDPHVLYFAMGHYMMQHAIIFRQSKNKLWEFSCSTG
jgi:hypothetical protein